MNKMYRLILNSLAGMVMMISAGHGFDGTAVAQATLIADDSISKEDGNLTLGIRIRMEDGWKTYWRQVGDAGLPPELNWQQREGAETITMLYPAPQRYEEHGLETIGYEGEVVFPLRIKMNGETLKLKGTLDYVVCREVCLLVQQDLAATILPHDEATKITRDGQALRRALMSLPVKEHPYPFKVTKAAWVQKGDLHHWDIVAVNLSSFEDPDIFIETIRSTEDEGAIWLGEPWVRLSQDKKRVWLTTKPEEYELEKTQLRITLVDGEQAVEQIIPVTFETARDKGGRSYLMLLLFAFLGGLILNVMPCVLPVLSLKLFSILRHRDDIQTKAGLGRARQSLLANAVGIYGAFGVLAVMLWALKSGGTAVGWGFHFQEPIFILVMAGVMLLFAANLAGWTRIALPAFAVNYLSHRGKSGDIANGAFATLLATPCSAPFLGVAVGFALAGGAWDLAMIFVMLATGFAFPWLMLAGFPQSLSLLPRSGSWMVTMERVFAVLLLMTAFWLMTIFVTQIERQENNETMTSAFWQEFQPEEIASLTEQGKVVFVDVTADWCLTCRVNEVRVLERSPVKELLGQESIVAMRADWTNRDEFIGAWLQSFGRSALPFYVVFGENAKDGIVLPELLTDDRVKKALAEATATKGDES